MENVEVKTLLGLEFGDPVVQNAIKVYELPPKRPVVPKGEEYKGIESKSKGIDLNFTPVEKIGFPIRTQFPEGALLVSAIFLYRGGVAGHKEYMQPLPHGLSFSLGREQVKKLLGKPSWSSPVLPIDRWEFGRYRLLTDYSEDEKHIDSVTLHWVSE